MNNAEIRRVLSENRFPMWKLAEWLGISESALVRMFRKEVPGAVQEKILHVIECVKTSQPYDNSFIRDYMRQCDKRFNNRERTAEMYARYVAKGLDEAEKRRMEGGWDLSL